MAMFTPESPKLTSKPVSGKSSLSLTEILEKADLLFPNAVTIFVNFPQKSNNAIRIGKKQLQESTQNRNTRIWLNQYSGKVLQVQDELKLSRANVVFSSFIPMHFGTFGGIPTRILYVFVGLSPLLLFVTGANMFKTRKWGKAQKKEVRDLLTSQSKEEEPQIHS